MQKRLPEVDSARGIAIMMMLISNFLFDLYFFSLCSSCYSGFWLYFARATAGLFILLAGASLTVSYSRVKERPKNFIAKKFLKRGGRIFLYGMLITLVTFIFIPQSFIVFGILHLIGASIILSYPFLKRKYFNLVLGIIIILIGLPLQNIAFGFPWLLWLGMTPEGFSTVDYNPIFPWFGVFLIGMFLGNLLFPGGERSFEFFDLGNSPIIKLLTKMGRNSLRIYLIHQPVFIGIIFLLLSIQ